MNTVKTLSIAFLFCFYSAGYAQGVNYEKWETVLNKYVDGEGRVNYAELKKNRKKLDEFIREEIEEASLEKLSSDEKKAFWINAYNVDDTFDRR